MLTLTNRLQRCAADTGRCIAAGEKSPPEKTNNSLCLQKVPSFQILEPFVLSHSHTHAEHTQNNTHTHTSTHTLRFQSHSLTPPGSQGLLTDLAYFLEVELGQGVEPVGQLSEVEKLHLKPGAGIQLDKGEKVQKSG